MAIQILADDAASQRKTCCETSPPPPPSTVEASISIPKSSFCATTCKANLAQAPKKEREGRFQA